MRALSLRALAVALVSSAALFLLGACATDGGGVESCRQIEEARCKKAPACGIVLSPPMHREGDGQDVTACIRFYRDACLHGFEAREDRGSVEVRACVAAIDTGDCRVVKNPEVHSACSFLTPKPEVPAADAGIDALALPVDAATGG